MDSRHVKQSVPQTADKSNRTRATRALAQSIGELVDRGILLPQVQTEFLGQASIWLEQGQRAATVLRSSGSAMINNGLGSGNLPWDRLPLHQDEQFRVAVIAVDPNRPAPVHDHPGTDGILVVLEGHLIEHRYQLEASDEARTGKVNLVVGETRYLDAGQSGIYLSTWNNLHSLAAAGRAAIALSIQMNPFAESWRSWFLPVDAVNGDRIAAVRTHLGLLSSKLT